jgi:serine/threonine protein kinase
MDASCSSKYWDCVGSELQAEEDPNLIELSQQTHYGSAPEYLWSELAEPEEDAAAARLVQETDKYEDEIFRHRTSVNVSRLAIVESIAQGGQAHVSLAKWPGKQRSVVVKRYKGRLGVRAVHELRRRIVHVKPKRRNTRLCELIGLAEDNITGEVSVFMWAYSGDLRNLIDKRMDYLKSRMRSNMQDDDDPTKMMMMMPFPYRSTLVIMQGIALGMIELCEMGIIHRDLKASNIFVTPGERGKDGIIRSHFSGQLELKENWAYDWFFVHVGDYETSDGVVGTGFWRPPEVLKAVKEDIRPTFTTAADVYGFGMVCYELLTGHIPFQSEGVRRTDYDAVLSGRRPKLPDYLSPGMTQLLLKCWHQDPCQRPSWDQIKKTLRTERQDFIEKKQRLNECTFLTQEYA